MALTMESAFAAAVDRVNRARGARLSNDAQLELYASFKQANVGDAPLHAACGMFDGVARAKHGAWARLRGTSREAAMALYVAAVAKHVPQ